MNIFIILLSSMLFFTSLFAIDIGTITAFKGQASIKRNGNLIPLTLGAKIEEKDEIITANKTKVQIIFIDETIITIGKNSNFSIYAYFYEEANQEPKAEFGIFKGAMRTITGKIGKIAPEKFKVKTATATIGIRGTNFTVVGNSVYCTYGAITVQVKSTGKSVLIHQGSFIQVNKDGKTKVQEFSAEDIAEVTAEEFSGSKEETDSQITSKDTQASQTKTTTKQANNTEETDTKLEIQNIAPPAKKATVATIASTPTTTTTTTTTTLEDTTAGSLIITDVSKEVNNDLVLSINKVDSLVEDSAHTGDVVATITASDSDGGNIKYSLLNNTDGYLAINSATGEVSLTSTGARLINKGGDLPRVTVNSESTSGLTSTNTSPLDSVATTNINDALVLSLTPTRNLTKDALDAGTLITTVSATDEDGDILSYSLSGNDNGYLNIDSSTGEITLTTLGKAYLITNHDLPDVTINAFAVGDDFTSTESFTLSLFNPIVGRNQLDTENDSIEEYAYLAGENKGLNFKGAIEGGVFSLLTNTSITIHDSITDNNIKFIFDQIPVYYTDMENFSFKINFEDSQFLTSGTLNEFKTVADLDETDSMSWGEFNLDYDDTSSGEIISHSIRELWALGPNKYFNVENINTTYTYNGKWRAYVNSSLKAGLVNLKIDFSNESSQIIFNNVTENTNLTYNTIDVYNTHITVDNTSDTRNLQADFTSDEGLALIGYFNANPTIGYGDTSTGFTDEVIEGVFQAKEGFNEVYTLDTGRTINNNDSLEGSTLNLEFSPDRTSLVTNGSFVTYKINDKTYIFNIKNPENLSSTSNFNTEFASLTVTSGESLLNSSSFKTQTDISESDYMSWGSWDASINNSDETENLVIKDAYWISGSTTPISIVDARSSTATYNGAYIGHETNVGAINGDANMAVNFDSPALTTLTLAASTNTLSSMRETTYNMNISGNTLTGIEQGGAGTASGTFYGPTGSSIGGSALISGSTHAKVVYQVNEIGK